MPKKTVDLSSNEKINKVLEALEVEKKARIKKINSVF